MSEWKEVGVEKTFPNLIRQCCCDGRKIKIAASKEKKHLFVDLIMIISGAGGGGEDNATKRSNQLAKWLRRYAANQSFIEAEKKKRIPDSA